MIEILLYPVYVVVVYLLILLLMSPVILLAGLKVLLEGDDE